MSSRSTVIVAGHDPTTSEVVAVLREHTTSALDQQGLTEIRRRLPHDVEADCLVVVPEVDDSTAFEVVEGAESAGVPTVVVGTADDRQARAAVRAGATDLVLLEDAEAIVGAVRDATTATPTVDADTTPASVPATATTPRRSQLDAPETRLAAARHGLLQALMYESDRNQLARVVCERLSANPPLQLALYAPFDEAQKTASPTVVAGLDRARLRTSELSLETETLRPIVDRHHVSVVDEVDPETVPELTGTPAQSHGYRSVAYVPVTDGQTLDGLLAIYATTTAAFDTGWRTALADLGRELGYALTQLDRTTTRASDGVTELEFEIADQDILTVWLSTVLDCRVSLRGVSVDGDGVAVLFLDVEDVDSPASARAALAAHDDIAAASVVGSDLDSNAAVLRCVMREARMARYLAERGAVLKSVTASEGIGRARVELDATSDVRSFVDRITAAYDDAELLARRERAASRVTPWEFRSQVESGLTDRQFDALQSAYYMGYFEWPRSSTGADVAETMGIAQPTFLQHLRTAEAKLLEAFFEDQRTVYASEE